jgi:hypothetical protein
MIRGLRVETTLTYSQTLNGYDLADNLSDQPGLMQVLSGPFLVSRTGDEG